MRRSRPAFLFLAFCLILLCGCARSGSVQLYAMDTVIDLEVLAENPEDALALAENEILRLDRLLSISDPDSEIVRLNAGESTVLSGETAGLLRTALSISEATGGAYDCTIAPVVQAWGWYSDSTAVPTEDTLKAASSRVGFRFVSLEGNSVRFAKENMAIDLGGIGKGYAAGVLHSLLLEAGVTSGMLSLGGNVRTIGAKPDGSPWVVGIADPEAPSSYLCTVSVADCAVVTSGDYQRYFVENDVYYHHIFDPNTGYPAENGLHSVTVVCRDDTLADGLSTALFVMGVDGAIDFWRSQVYDFEAVLIADSGIYVTNGLERGFSCSCDYEVIFP